MLCTLIYTTGALKYIMQHLPHAYMRSCSACSIFNKYNSHEHTCGHVVFHCQFRLKGRSPLATVLSLLALALPWQRGSAAASPRSAGAAARRPVIVGAIGRAEVGGAARRVPHCRRVAAPVSRYCRRSPSATRRRPRRRRELLQSQQLQQQRHGLRRRPRP